MLSMECKNCYVVGVRRKTTVCTDQTRQLSQEGSHEAGGVDTTLQFRSGYVKMAEGQP